VERIYLDHNATTPLDPRVLEAMLPVLREDFGNASSLHHFGQRARAALEQARAELAELIGAAASEIVFTSGGTEADNLALLGVAHAAREPRRKILYAAIEHHAVVNAARALGDEGFPVESVRATAAGQVDLEELALKLDDTTALVALMLANNETGVLQPVEQVVRMARARGALVHCDAVQAAGKVALDVKALGVDSLALSAHKMYGP
jgi:cysteine desulfurase